MDLNRFLVDNQKIFLTYLAEISKVPETAPKEVEPLKKFTQYEKEQDLSIIIQHLMSSLDTMETHVPFTQLETFMKLKNLLAQEM